MCIACRGYPDSTASCIHITADKRNAPQEHTARQLAGLCVELALEVQAAPCVSARNGEWDRELRQTTSGRCPLPLPPGHESTQPLQCAPKPLFLAAGQGCPALAPITCEALGPGFLLCSGTIPRRCASPNQRSELQAH